jgi:hypothetical protein
MNGDKKTPVMTQTSVISFCNLIVEKIAHAINYIMYYK